MTQSENLAEFVRVLDDFAKNVGINKFQNTSAIDNILSSSEIERNLWQEEEIYQKSFTLFNYCAYLQRCTNQNTIKLKWAQSNIRVLYGRETPKYNRFSYIEKQDAVISEDSSVHALHEIILNAEARIEQLRDISRFVSEMARCLVELAKSKRASRYENRS